MTKRLTAATAIAVSLLAQPPALTDQQRASLSRMSDGLAARVQAVNEARMSLVRASLADPRDNAAIEGAAETVGRTEWALASGRAEALASLQASDSRLTPDQLAAFRAAGGTVVPGRSAPSYVAGGTIPKITQAQLDALTRLTTSVEPLLRAVNRARAALTAAALTLPRKEAALRSQVDAVTAAERALAEARADAFGKLQRSAERLDPVQAAAFAAMGGSFAGVRFTQPDPMDFNDHEDYVPLFDGVSLKGWDGNPKFWRVENGAIVGESTVQNPSGNSYLVYRDLVAKDFTLKFEIKVEGSGGSGFQYRSKTGIPWLAQIPDTVLANTGPVNLDWMMTGPQADFWPSSRDWTGQFYSENTAMRILAWRGQVVEGAGLARKQLMGTIGDRQALNSFVKMNDWNQYTVIARGGTLMHIVNGQLMAVMVDDDPASSNNQAGFFGIEIEATTRVSVRNIWVKKLN